MEWSRCFKLFFFLSLLALAGARELKVRHKHHVSPYYPTLARTLVEYASAVYMSDFTSLVTWTCERCNGMTKGFEMIELIVDVQHCLQAYVGVAEDLKAIIVAFRGTQEHSIQNWVEELFWKQLDVNYPGMPDAMVHHGFYSAYHNTAVRPGILDAIDRAKELYGDLQILVTGHSMGGAMASFCALDLVVNHRADNIYLMTFGQPRVGNAAFSSYFNLCHVFDKFDANGDGRISLSELEQMLRSLGGGAEESEAMMREADADGDRFISLEEFVAVNKIGEGDSVACVEDLRRAFGVQDRDGNGVISAEELHHVLRSMGEKASLSACRSMIRSVDRNGDGAVNFDEFLLMMGGRCAPRPTPHA